MPENIFTEGLYFELPHSKAPDFVKGKLSIKVEDFISFLGIHQNEKGYVNIKLLESKGGKGYATLDTWKPESKKKEVETPKDLPDNMHVQTSAEYPEEANGEIPF